MRTFLKLLFLAILLAMLAITTYASMERNLVDAGRELMTDRWFQATLLDAYFGFLTFYVWVAYKEQSLGRRLLWFVLIMCLGNIAMAIYMLIQLAQLRSGAPIGTLLLRSKDTPV